jgi:hypothetical protein
VVRPYSLVIGSMQRKQVPEPLALAVHAHEPVRGCRKMSLFVALGKMLALSVGCAGKGGVTPVPVSREHPIRRHERNGESRA